MNFELNKFYKIRYKPHQNPTKHKYFKGQCIKKTDKSLYLVDVYGVIHRFVISEINKMEELSSDFFIIKGGGE